MNLALIGRGLTVHGPGSQEATASAAHAGLRLSVRCVGVCDGPYFPGGGVLRVDQLWVFPDRND